MAASQRMASDHSGLGWTDGWFFGGIKRANEKQWLPVIFSIQRTYSNLLFFKLALAEEKAGRGNNSACLFWRSCLTDDMCCSLFLFLHYLQHRRLYLPSPPTYPYNQIPVPSAVTLQRARSDYDTDICGRRYAGGGKFCLKLAGEGRPWKAPLASHGHLPASR